MSKIPKKDIDRIFRDGSDRYDFPFNQEAWKNMEDLLDREKRRRVLIWWTAGILLFLLLILLFFWLKPSHSSPPSAPPEVSGQAIADLDRKSDTPNAGAAILPDASPAAPPVDGSKNGEISRLDVRTADPPSHPFKAGEETLSGTPRPERPLASPPSRSPSDWKQIPAVAPTTGRQETGGGREPSSAPEQTGWGEASPSEPAGIWAPLSFAASLEINPLFSSASRIRPDLPESQSSAKAPKNKRRNRLLLGAAFAPEFNSVGFRDLSAVSWKWGVRLEYQYAGKFGFTAGVHHVNKKYRAGAGSYTPPKGFWTRKIAPVETDGECTVLEIPVGLTFYPKGYDQSGFFSEVGMSSFLMLEEHYYYHYDVPDNDLVRYWGGENENRHWLGILNLSVGYNLLISRHFSARLAPYAQIPLSGVGHGQVKLTDVGLHVSLHYGLLKN
jgi:hypothetical protein